MKKILLLIAGLTFSASATRAQALQNIHKTITFVRVWGNCADSYTPWTVGLFDTLAAIQNTPAFPAYFLQYDEGPDYGMSDLPCTEALYLESNKSPDYANQPGFAVDNQGLPIFEMTNSESTYTGYIYPGVVDTLAYYVHENIAAPAVVSVGFDKVMVTSDSVLIKTKTRFNIDEPGMFNVAVYAIEDSVKRYQASMVPGKDSFYHRNMIRGAVQWGTWGMTIGNDTLAHAGDTYLQDFTCKIPSNWNIAKLSYYVVVYKSTSVLGTKHILNSTDGNYLNNVALGTTPIANTDLTNNLSVYPVPAKNYINVVMQTKKPLDNCTISLYDISGRRVAELYTGDVLPGKQLTLQLPRNLAAGNYMLQLYNESASAVKQVTIK
jgi:outer membrane protein Omp28/type IX secretion system substrate protein